MQSHRIRKRKSMCFFSKTNQKIDLPLYSKDTALKVISTELHTDKLFRLKV
jgi:hypothetical protein